MAKHFKQDVERSAAPSRPRRTRRRQVPKRAVLTLVLALAVVGVAVGGVIAWLSAANQVANQFEVGTVTPTVNEKFDGENKENVNVTNSGNVPIYVRAQIHIYWQDANGNQLWDKPVVDTDYEIVWGLTGSKWVEGEDGFYYWTEPLRPGEENKTANLINSLTDKTTHTDGRKLVCDIAVQGIQADPADAVLEAWNPPVTAVDSTTGALTITPKAGA